MRDLLKFITCGSVDDGKSTLIGHILYDAKLIYADQEKALSLDSKIGSRGGNIDYSLLLDGLTEEREQGITIDVAYRYFSTDARSFIVADTPGHEQYTRNMAVGASFADLAILLIDARQGVLVQTRRHARICAMMGISHFVFAVNKMDLAGYSRERFEEIVREAKALAKELRLKDVVFIPVSATEGDNVTGPSANMPWYQGKTLLRHLEEVVISGAVEEGFYLPVQRVSRPNHTFRGFQGEIEAGSIAVGDEVLALPGGERAGIRQILSGSREVSFAQRGDAVTIVLDREVDVSRGSVLASDISLHAADGITASLLWMDDTHLEQGKNFFVKIGTKLIPGIVSEILYAVDVNTGEHQTVEKIGKNEMAVCRIAFTDKVVADEFRRHKTLGELILIDRISFMTSACGTVLKIEDGGTADIRELRKTLSGQTPVTILIPSLSKEKAKEVERLLVSEGRNAYYYDEEGAPPSPEVISHLNAAGVIVLLSDAAVSDPEFLRAEMAEASAKEIAALIKRASAYGVVSRGAEYI